MCESCGDDYEISDPFTIGGASGIYFVPSPYHTECEWALVSAAAVGGFNTSNVVYALTINSAARATYTSGVVNVSGIDLLMIDFNVTAITGGASPTVTFRISRQNTDGTLYQMEQAAALSAAGTISYNLGTGLDNKDFGDNIQIDMILTGAPTSVTFSGGIKGRSTSGPTIGQAATFVIGSKNPTPPILSIFGVDKFGPISDGVDNNNALPAYPGCLTIQAPFITYAGDAWMPLASPAFIYLQTVAPFSTEVLCTVQFRRKLDRVIPDKPRAKPHTHSHVGSRRGYRTQSAGYESQYGEPGAPYQHEPLPVSQDTSVGKRGVSPLQPTQTEHRRVGRNGR